MNTRFDYVLVRVVPSLIREETLNVGIIASHAGRVITRFLEHPTRALSALAPPTVIDAVLSVGSRLFKASESSPDTKKWRISNVERRTFLRDLCREGLSGFVLSEIRTSLLKEPTLEAAVAVVERLFDDLVQPKYWPAYRATSHGVRAGQAIKRILDENRISPQIVPRKVVITTKRFRDPFEVSFAYANGQVGFGQAVDLDVAPDTQKKNTDAAISVASQLNILFRTYLQTDLSWTNVVALNDNSDAAGFIEHLKLIGPVLRVSESDDFIEHIRGVALEAVDERFRKVLGLAAQLEGDSLTLKVPGESTPLASWTV